MERWQSIGIPGVWKSGMSDFWISSNRNKSEVQKSGCRESPISGVPDLQISGFLEICNLGVPEIQKSEFRISGALASLLVLPNSTTAFPSCRRIQNDVKVATYKALRAAGDTQDLLSDAFEFM